MSCVKTQAIYIDKSEKGFAITNERTFNSMNTKTQNGDYGYYSKLLKKPFDTLDELKKAEEIYNKAHAEEIKKAEEKKAEAKAVEDAYKEYVRINNEGVKASSDAYNKFIVLRNAFINKHGSYHSTTSDIHDYAVRGDWKGFFDSFFEQEGIFNLFK